MKNKALLAVVAAALLVRVAVALSLPVESVVNDAAEYDTIAWNLASGNGFSMEPGLPTPTRGPGFPVFLALLYAVFGHAFLAGTLAHAALGALACWLTWRIANRLFGPGPALAAAWFSALYPVSIAYSNMLMSETLFTVFFLGSIDFFLRSEGGSRRGDLVISGVLLALATLTRATTMLFPLGAALALFVSGRPRPLLNSLIFALAWAAAIAPWTLRNYRQFGTYLPVATGGSTCLYATGVEAEGGTYQQGFDQIAEKLERFKASPEYGAGLHPSIKFDRGLKQEASGKIKANLSGYLSVVLRRIPKYWFSSHSSLFGVDRPLSEYRAEGRWGPIAFRLGLIAFHAGLCALALLGMYYWRRTFRAWAILLLVFLYFNMHATFDMCPRYFVPIFPYLFVFCGAALAGLRARLRGEAA